MARLSPDVVWVPMFGNMWNHLHSEVCGLRACKSELVHPAMEQIDLQRHKPGRISAKRHQGAQCELSALNVCGSFVERLQGKVLPKESVIASGERCLHNASLNTLITRSFSNSQYAALSPNNAR